MSQMVWACGAITWIMLSFTVGVGSGVFGLQAASASRLRPTTVMTQRLCMEAP